MKWIALVVLAGCANSYQSAWSLPRGTTQVTVAMSRTEVITEDGGTRKLWLGELGVRTGVREHLDAGLRFVRSPGRADFSVGGTHSMLAFDLKWSAGRRDGKRTIAFALPVGVVWSEREQLDEADRLAYVIAPSIFFGMRLSPDLEFVASPKLFFITPNSPDYFELDTEMAIGASIGLRFRDAAGAWAVHPEIGFLRISPSPITFDRSETFVMLGVGITAGN